MGNPLVKSTPTILPVPPCNDNRGKCRILSPLNKAFYVPPVSFIRRGEQCGRQIGKFAECIKASHWPVEDAFLQIWAKSLNLEKELFLAQAFLRLMVDNFYMRITEQSMDFDWLADYLQELTSMVKSIEIRNKM